MNPSNGKHRERLSKCLQHHFRELQWARKSNADMVRQYAGSRYGKQFDITRRTEDCINLMLQAAEAYTIALAANAPRFLCSSDNPELFGFANHFGRALNALVREIRLEETLEDVFRDAFFSWGTTKTYMASAGQKLISESQDVWLDPGQPFVQRISPDNRLHDTAAADWRRKSFAADKYLICEYDLHDKERFDQVAVEKLKPVNRWDGEDDERADKITGPDHQGDNTSYEDQYLLADVYLAREGLICTFGVNPDFTINSAPLATLEWDGPEEGPYDMLSMGPVPDNIVPTSPGANMRAMHELSNSLFRKQARQAKRQKEIYVVQAGEEKMGKAARTANDGDMITGNGNVKEVIASLRTGGADPATLAFLLQTLTLANKFNRNPEAALGLGSQSPTAAQDELIHQQLTRGEAMLMNRSARFTGKLGSNLGNLMWVDQVKTIPLSIDMRLDGYKPVRADWRPGQRSGSFQDYKLAVEPYSQAHRSPSQRLAAINQFVLPFIQNPQLAQMSGMQLDLQEWVALNAELLNEPWILRVLKADYSLRNQETSAEAPGSSGGQSQRTYVRKNVAGGPSEQGRNTLLTQQAMAGAGYGGAANNALQTAQ